MKYPILSGNIENTLFVESKVPLDNKIQGHYYYVIKDKHISRYPEYSPKLADLPTWVEYVLF